MFSKQIASVRSIATFFASIIVLMVLTQSGQAQTFTVLHNFTGGADGAYPDAGLTMDTAETSMVRLMGTATATVTVRFIS